MSKQLKTLLFLFSIFSSTALAADVSISPPSITVSPSSQFTVNVNVANVSNLFGAAFDLVYNPAVVQFISAQKGVFLEQDGVSTNLLTSASPPGTLIVGYSRLANNGVATGITGSGSLMTLTFNALTTGTSNLSFQNNALCDANSGSGCGLILTNWTPGIITISGVADTVAPSAPANLKAAPISSGQINLSWTASTDNIGIAGYRVYRNGINIANVNTVSYANTGLSPLTTYIYTISAFDAAGNESLKSSQISATTLSLTITTSTATGASTITTTTPKFSINQRVQTSAKLNVRNTASLTGTAVGYQSIGAQGIVVGGPIQSGGYTWWQINYDFSPDGWSVENWLIASTSQPPSTSQTTVQSTTQTTTQITASQTTQTTTQTTTVSSCVSFPIGQRVKTTANLNVRASGSITSARLGTQILGSKGTITGGPVQADGYAWRQINYDFNPDGWSACNWLIQDTSTFQPPSTSQTTTQSTATQIVQSSTTTSSQFILNQRIKTNFKISVRNSASTGGALLGYQNIGAFGIITGGPVQSGGYTWWQINYDTNPDGWSVGNWLVSAF